ncbi:MAG: hypothetical protein EB049_05750 [Actinobacteria bacterium]|nr:hypothetical protein [Actinomycetota bacterium]
MTRFTGLSETEQRQIRMYGCTELQMKEAVEQSLTFRFSGPALMAASIMSDCQEMLTQGAEDSMIREDVRQALNRAKWILFQYGMQRPVA